MSVPTGTSLSYLDFKNLEVIKKPPHFQLEMPGGNRFWKGTIAMVRKLNF